MLLIKWKNNMSFINNQDEKTNPNSPSISLGTIKAPNMC